jgi:hypothetical protein
MTTSLRVLFIRCRFSDDAGPQPRPDSYYTRLFGHISNYWADMSFGELELYEGSELTPWLTLTQRRADYVGSGANQPGRDQLVAWAKAAVEARGGQPADFPLVLVTTHQGVDTFGGAGRAVFGPGDAPATILQEVGHGLGIMGHSRSVANPTDYTDPYCVMSAMTFGGQNNPPPTFQDPVLGASGPGLCSPYMFNQGWLTGNRLVRVPSNGVRPDATVLTLSPLAERQSSHPQVAMFELSVPQPVRYFAEYRAGSWDRGLQGPPVVVHQLRPDGIPYYAGNVNTKTRLPYRDNVYDVSVSVLPGAPPGTATVSIAAAAAVGILSVRQVAARSLGLTQGFALRPALMAGVSSVRQRLVQLL